MESCVKDLSRTHYGSRKLLIVNWFGYFQNTMAERVGFEPTVGANLRSISSRVPSTGLSHLSVPAEAGRSSYQHSAPCKALDFGQIR